jgi:hypothetical protein
MNIQKNMEFIFICVLTIIGLSTAALENLPKAVAKNVTVASIAAPANMPVVVIRAPRALERI